MKFNITQRYLSASFILPFVFSTLFFVTFLLTFQMFRLVKVLISKDVTFLTMMELLGHIAISFLPIAIPLSALFATIYTLNKLSEDSEIVAMRSFGLKKFDILKPFLIIGILISLCIYSLNKNLIPYSKGMFKNTIIKLTSKGLLSNIKAENFFTDIPNITLFAEEVSEDGLRFKNLFIVMDEDNNKEKIITAKDGTLIKRVLSNAQTPALRFFLKDGSVFEHGESNAQKILFKEYDFPIIRGGSRHGFITKDSMLNSSELKKKYVSLEKELATSKNEGRISHLKSAIVKAKLEFLTRVNIPMQCLLFIFLGFGLGIKKSRGDNKNNGTLGLVFLILYYIIFFTGISMAKKGNLYPSVAVFLPTVLISILSIKIYKQLDWAS